MFFFCFRNYKVFAASFSGQPSRSLKLFLEMTESISLRDQKVLYTTQHTNIPEILAITKCYTSKANSKNV